MRDSEPTRGMTQNVTLKHVDLLSVSEAYPQTQREFKLPTLHQQEDGNVENGMMLESSRCVRESSNFIAR